MTLGWLFTTVTCAKPQMIHCGFCLGCRRSHHQKEGLEIIHRLLDELTPSAIIAVEKSSPNPAGLNHSLPGRDLTPVNGKYHLLVEEARRRGIFTVGIGDGGNEIGMGNVHEEVRQYLRTGATCYCGCGQGVAATTKTDVLMVAYVSNWGAYGIEAAFSLLLQRYEIMHDGELRDFSLTRGPLYDETQT